MNPGFVLLVAGICVLAAASLGAFWAKSRAARAQAEALGRSRAAEARVEELRRQIEALDADLDSLRGELSRADAARSTAEARLEGATKSVAEQRALLDEAKVRFADAFRSLAADALAHNSKGFLVLAEEKFKALSQSAQTDLESRRSAVAELIAPLSAALSEYQKEARGLEEKRLREIGTVGEQLRALAVSQGQLQNETSRLVNALKSPQVRGRWGEIALRKTAELAGMTRYCDFVEQESVDTDQGRLRPDLVVKLPAGREVVVDSKVPLGGFMDALEADSEDGRAQAMQKHAAQMRQHISRLSSKEYWNQFPTAPEFVVMFIPNDSFLAAAAEQDPGLVESALAQNVVIATPTTFIALLRAVAFGWRQEVMTENAQRISALGQELADRMATVSAHLSDLGRAMTRSVEAYNAAVGSFENRLFASARKFRELGVEGKKEISEPALVDYTPRQLDLSPLDLPDSAAR